MGQRWLLDASVPQPLALVSEGRCLNALSALAIRGWILKQQLKAVQSECTLLC